MIFHLVSLRQRLRKTSAHPDQANFSSLRQSFSTVMDYLNFSPNIRIRGLSGEDIKLLNTSIGLGLNYLVEAEKMVKGARLAKSTYEMRIHEIKEKYRN